MCNQYTAIYITNTQSSKFQKTLLSEGMLLKIGMISERIIYNRGSEGSWFDFIKNDK